MSMSSSWGVRFSSKAGSACESPSGSVVNIAKAGCSPLL